VTWFFAVLIVLVMGAIAVVASGRGGDALGKAYDDRADVRLPADRPVTSDDLRALRFNTALRGYRASEVDALLDRLASQLDEQGRGPDKDAAH